MSEKKSKKIIIDIGTGSGCIIISLVKQLIFRKSLFSNCIFYASDISKRALAIAKKNARLHITENHIKFLQSDLLKEFIPISKFQIPNPHLFILANLPYLTPAQIKESHSIQHEPKLALEAGDDGLKYYKKLFRQVKSIKSTDQTTIFCEIDESQTENFLMLAKSSFIDIKYNIAIKNDLAGFPRIGIVDILT